MINASIARQIATTAREDAIADTLEIIGEYINEAANAGEFSCRAAFPIPSCYENIENVLVRHVEETLATFGYNYGNQSENVNGELVISIWW